MRSFGAPRSVLALSFISWAFIAIAVLSISFANPPANLIGGLLRFSVPAGMFFGALMLGMLADKHGRKLAWLISVSFFSVASLLCCIGMLCIESNILFAALCFLIGFGCGGGLPVISSFLAEHVKPSVRGSAIVVLESFWAIGTIAIALSTLLIREVLLLPWQYVFVPASIAILLIPVIAKVGESPLYRKYVSEKKRIPLSEIFKRFTRVTVMLWISWFMIAFHYYGIFLWLPKFLQLQGFLQRTFTYIFIMALAQLPGYYSAAYLVEKIGRKLTLTIYFTLTGVFTFLFAYPTVIDPVTSAILLSFFSLGCWGAIYAYTPELYPTGVRVSAFGYASSVARIGALIATILPALTISSIGYKPTIAIYAIAMIIPAPVIYALGRETKGIELE
ncbi:MFS transporter [archaeon]|nr:MAG: MFS transporter [archaeon]RLG65278.1 MAG: MFS transporter [archaeon]